MNATDLIAAPLIKPEDMVIHIVPLNATIHLPWAFEPLVHWIFSGLIWIMGY